MPIDTYPAPAQSTPGAVLGYAQATATQGAITSEVDVVSLSVTFTVPAGRRLKVTTKLLATSTVAGDIIEVMPKEGAAYLGNSQLACGTAGAMETVAAIAIVSPSAGTHSYKATIRRNAGSGTVSIYADANVPSYILVEDITGGSGGPGPISLGYAESQTPQTGITTAVDLAGLTVTVTVPAGRRLRISGHTLPSSSVGGDQVECHVYEDGVRRATAAGNVTGTNAITLAPTWFVTPTAGTHTYKLVMLRYAGTGTVVNNAGAGYPSYLAVDDVTGTPAPGGLLPSSQTLGYAQITTAITGIPSAKTDLAGLAVTVAVPSGRRLKITAFVLTSCSVATFNDIAINEDTIEVERSYFDPATTTDKIFTHSFSVIVTPTAGTHTYKLSSQFGSGTGRTYAATTAPEWILVEDITGGALPVPAASVPVGLLAQAVKTTSQSGLGAAWTAIAGLSVNVVVPAGRTLKVTARSHMQNSVVGGAGMRIEMDGTGQVEAYEYGTNAGSGFEVVAIALVSPSAGAHAFTVSGWCLQGGSGTQVGSATIPAYLFVEDVTPTPAPATTAPSSTLGYAEVLGNQSGITTEVDLTGLTVNVTVPAGRRVKVTARGRWQTDTVGAGVLVSIYQDGSMVQQYAEKTPYNNTSLDFYTEWVGAPSAGAHTYKLRMSQYTAGIVLLGAAATIPAFILVEDITAASVPVVPGAAQGFDVGAASLTDSATAASTWADWGTAVTVPNPGFPVKIVAYLTGFLQDFTQMSYCQTHVDISMDGGASYTSGRDVNGVVGQTSPTINRNPVANTHFRSGQPTGSIVLKARINGQNTSASFVGGTLSYVMVPA